MGIDPQIGDLVERVKKVAADVRALWQELDALFAWTRSCYRCGKELKKEKPDDVVRCDCGWVWE